MYLKCTTILNVQATKFEIEMVQRIIKHKLVSPASAMAGNYRPKYNILHVDWHEDMNYVIK